MDFAAEPQGQPALRNPVVSQVAMKGIEGQNPHYPPGVGQSMVEADFVWAADQSCAHRRPTDATLRRQGEELRSAMRRLMLGVLFAIVATTAAAQERVRLEVYSTLEVENIDDFKKAFEAENPRHRDRVELRDSTGVLTAKHPRRAECPARRRDLGPGRHLDDDAQGARPARSLCAEELAALRPSFRDPVDPPSYVGMEGWVAAVCFNTVEGQEARPAQAAIPWFDLLDPKFKGKITMPHPASSGTGYFHVSAWIQTFGEEKAWAFMDRLHENIAMYVHSGAQPCRMTAAGEFPVGISAEIPAAPRCATRGRRSTGC